MTFTRLAVCSAVLACPALGLAQSDNSAGARMQAATGAFIKSLTDEQRQRALFKFDDPERLNWHFIPRERNGVSLRELEGDARTAAHNLIKTGLSTAGYEQTLKVMSLEEVLYLIEGGKEAERRERRHPHKYHLSIFGSPAYGDWGWRVEGHHISLNYTLDKQKIVSSTPEFFGANPGQIDSGPGRTLRVLGEREDLGRQILKLCTAEQKKTLYISETPPKEIRDAGVIQPDVGEPEGLAYSAMSREQQGVLKKLLATYLAAAPLQVKRSRLRAIDEGGIDNVHFAWWGGSELNEPHHYRVQGPTFVIEYNNTQNSANHVHSIWRNVAGDFGLPREGEK